MASRSATVLVIFVIAIIAFCLASVFGAMTGPISILPNGTDDGGSILDNLSAITDGSGDTGNSYGHDTYNDYGGSSDDSSSSNVETTTDNSGSGGSQSPGGESGQGSTTSNPNVETTVG